MFLKQTHFLAVGESHGASVMNDGDMEYCFHGWFIKAGKHFSGICCLQLRGGNNSDFFLS